MSDEVTTLDTLTDGADVTPTAGEGADNASISLEEIKSILGKEFKDKDTALKSIKDTYKYVGATGQVKPTLEAVKAKLGTDDAGVISALNQLMENPTPSADNFVSRDQYMEDMFFKENSNLAELREPLRAIKNASDSNKSMEWSAFVGSDTVKPLVEKVQGYNEAQSKKSVLETNPRLGVATDALGKARAALQEADKAAQNFDVVSSRAQITVAKEGAVGAVMEAFDIK